VYDAAKFMAIVVIFPAAALGHARSGAMIYLVVGVVIGPVVSLFAIRMPACATKGRRRDSDGTPRAHALDPAGYRGDVGDIEEAVSGIRVLQSAGVMKTPKDQSAGGRGKAPCAEYLGH
jgi:hypothetical protein